MKTTSDTEDATDENKTRHKTGTFQTVDGKRKHTEPEAGPSAKYSRTKRPLCSELDKLKGK